MAWEPPAQAVAMQKLGPVQPSFMPTRAAAALGIIMGTSIGETRAGPRENRLYSCSSWVMSPPTPAAATTPQRAGSAPSSPASARASAAAPKASWATRSVRRVSLLSKYVAGSKSVTSQAKRTGSAAGSIRPIGAAHERPTISVSQNVVRSQPAGVLTPMPVMATLVRVMRWESRLVRRRSW